MPASPPAETATLLVCCPDRRGIVAALAQLLYGHGANILEADQHTDRDAGVFFQRIDFDLSELHVDRRTLEAGVVEVAQRMEMRWRLSYADHVKRVAIFVSKTGHCLYDLLLRHQAGELACKIPLIVSNHPDQGDVARQFDIPYHVFPMRPETRAQQEGVELALLAEHGVELLVLARYMQVLSDEFLDRFDRPVINIHHSFLPAFGGGRPYHQAARRGVKLIGATAHYATADLTVRRQDGDHPLWSVRFRRSERGGHSRCEPPPLPEPRQHPTGQSPVPSAAGARPKRQRVGKAP